MQNGKRILSVTITREIDSGADIDYLGQYSAQPEYPYAIDRHHTPQCASQAYSAAHAAVDQLERILGYLNRQRLAASPEQNVAFSAAQDVLLTAQDDCLACDCPGGYYTRNQYPYFNPNAQNYTDLPHEEIIRCCSANYERAEALDREAWCFIGIRAQAEITIDENHHRSSWAVQTIHSGGLYGIESDSDPDYLSEIEKEELDELRSILTSLGFSQRAIAVAFKTVATRSR